MFYVRESQGPKNTKKVRFRGRKIPKKHQVKAPNNSCKALYLFKGLKRQKGADLGAEKCKKVREILCARRCKDKVPL